MIIGKDGDLETRIERVNIPYKGRFTESLAAAAAAAAEYRNRGRDAEKRYPGRIPN